MEKQRICNVVELECMNEICPRALRLLDYIAPHCTYPVFARDFEFMNIYCCSIRRPTVWYFNNIPPDPLSYRHMAQYSG